MELAIPLVALSGLYIISNQNQKKCKDKFTNMGKKLNELPNTNIPPSNYPIINNEELLDNNQRYKDTNVATNEYLNKNYYEQRNNNGLKIDNNIQDIYSLKGNYVSTDEFNHNNMIPFNGSKPKGNLYNDENTEIILDNYVGNGSQMIKKTEQSPLFSPQENIQWAFGSPNMNDFYQSRVNPVLKNSMVKPFESINVGPGLDKGYDTIGSNGFNSGMESRDKWMPKCIDELRVLTNQKEEYSLIGHQGPANPQIKNVGVLGKVEKYKPDKFYINSQDRWFTTTGAEKGQRIVPNSILKNSSRNETSKFITGTPNNSIKTASYIRPNYKKSKKVQFDELQKGHSNAIGTAPHIYLDNNMKSHTNCKTNRSILKDNNTFFGSGFNNAVGAIIAPIMDVLKPCKKEENIHNVRIYGNGLNKLNNSSNLQLNNKILKPTIKETTIYKPNTYIGNQSNDGYIISNNKIDNNQRSSTSKEQYGIAKGNNKNFQYDKYIYNNNINLEKEKSLVGRINMGNIDIFNSQMNMSISKNDTNIYDNRFNPPNLIIPSIPSTQTYGKINTKQDNNNINNIERLNGDILKAFIENPYTHSLTNSA